MGTRTDESDQEVVVLGLADPRVDSTKWRLTDRSDAPHEVLVQGDVLRADEVGVGQTDDQVIEDADVLALDSDVPLLRLGLGETKFAEVVALLGPEPASLLPGILPGEPEPVEEVALLESRR